MKLFAKLPAYRIIFAEFRIYSAIQDPVMVIAAKDVNENVSPMRSTHSVVAIVDIGTAQKSLLVPIEITAERKVNGMQMDVNTISSIYEKSVGNLVNEAIALENSGDIGIFYAKKEALTLPVAGVQFPAQLQQSIASNGIVHRFSEKVNMKISDVTQSQQFKRWFGDWQNDPKNASGTFTYGIQLRANKKIKAPPPLGSLLRSLDGVPNASTERVSQPGADVKQNVHNDSMR